MRLDWLEDILAVIETGSFSAAAERRFVTQPAFSRRIRAIEEQIGAELFDRERKPVALRPLAQDHQEDFRRLVTDMKDLFSELRRQGREAHNRVVIASQHALTATLAPDLVATMLKAMDTSVRLRSANRDECLALLMTKQADVLINYQTLAECEAGEADFVERAVLGEELLIPVVAATAASGMRDGMVRGELPIIAYPNDAFLGALFQAELLTRLPKELYVVRKVETALTLAAKEFALNGNGVAWVPANLVLEEIGDGRLVALEAELPSVRLAIVALRLTGRPDENLDRVWSEICSYASPAAQDVPAA